MHVLKQYIKDQNTIFITRDGTRVKIVDIDDGSDEYPLVANIIETDTEIWLTASGNYYSKESVIEEHNYDIVDYEKPEQQQPQPTTFTVGEYVTRDGRKAIVHYDISETLPNSTHTLFGYIKGEDGSRVWDINGNFNWAGYTDDDADLISPWVEPPYTITVNGKEFHPVKNPKNGEEYAWVNIDGVEINESTNWYMHHKFDAILANLNFVYHTKEEAQAFLNEITKPNAEIKYGT